MVSVLALPRVVLPLTDKLSVTVKSLPIVTSSGSPIRTWLFDTVVVISFDCAAKVSVSVPTVTWSVVVPSDIVIFVSIAPISVST